MKETLSKLTPRSVILIALSIFATAFVLFNYNRESTVWLFGTHHFATLWVILLSFGLGAVIGILGQSLLGMFRSRRVLMPAGEREREVVDSRDPHEMRAGERHHPGRP